MSKYSFYYIFEDGYKIKSSTMTGAKLLLLEHNHGKLITKKKV